MNKFLIMLAVSFLLAGCGQDSVRTQYVQVQAPAVPTDAIASVVADENAYRATVGQSYLSAGLTCTLYANITGSPDGIPGTPAKPPLLGNVAGSLPSSTASWLYIGNFNQPDSPASDGLNVIPSAIRTLYTAWFVVRCTGYVVITDNDYYNFTLTSDDASLLYVDGSLLVNNNGNHGTTSVSAMKQLRRGVHSFRLDYMEGPSGGQSLLLYTNGVLTPANIFYR